MIILVSLINSHILDVEFVLIIWTVLLRLVLIYPYYTLKAINIFLCIHPISQSLVVNYEVSRTTLKFSGSAECKLEHYNHHHQIILKAVIASSLYPLLSCYVHLCSELLHWVISCNARGTSDVATCLTSNTQMIKSRDWFSHHWKLTRDSSMVRTWTQVVCLRFPSIYVCVCVCLLSSQFIGLSRVYLQDAAGIWRLIFRHHFHNN